MRGLFLPVGADPLAVEGDWNDEKAVLDLIGAGLITCYMLQRSCKTCSALGIWTNTDPDVPHVPVNVTASELADEIITGNALIVGLDTDFGAIDLDEDELIRLAARVVLAEHKKLKQGETDA